MNNFTGFIENKEQFLAYVKRQLGDPVIDIEMTDEQMFDTFEEVLSLYNEYALDGTRYAALKFEITAFKSPFSLRLPDNIFAVHRVYSSDISFAQLLFGSSFTPGYSHLFGSSGAKSFMGQGFAFDLVSLQIFKEFSGVLESYRQNKLQHTYNRNTHELTLILPQRPTIPFQIICEVDSYLDPEDFPQIYNNRWFKRACTAKSRILWGTVLSKYGTMEMDGGYKIEPQNLIDAGKYEWEILIEDLELRLSEPSRMYVG